LASSNYLISLLFISFSQLIWQRLSFAHHLIVATSRMFSAMVRRHGKKRASAQVKSGNGEQTEEGESSFSRVDAHGVRGPKRRREKEQRLGADVPGLSFSYFPFEFGYIELDGYVG
jgi:hypothetical protein